MAQQEDLFKKVIAHCKEYGFVFPSSEIYDGLGAVYDYGQLGSELKNNIKRYWWEAMTLLAPNVVGIDSAIFMHPKIWKASGHVDAFNDPLIDNKDSKKRYRADVLIEDQLVAKRDDLDAARRLDAVQDVLHRLRPRLAVHRRHTEAHRAVHRHGQGGCVRARENTKCGKYYYIYLYMQRGPLPIVEVDIEGHRERVDARKHARREVEQAREARKRGAEQHRVHERGH